MLKLLGGLSILVVTAFWKMDTNKMNPSTPVTFSSISDLKGSARNHLDLLKKEYGEGYGTEFIYFPDGDGKLHYVNLSMTMKNEMLPGIAPGQVLDAMTDTIEFRLYNGNDSPYILLNEQGRAVNDAEQDVVNNIMRLHQPLKLITHGWRSTAEKDVLIIKKAYLQYQKVNVITVDWRTTAGSILYNKAAKDTKHVGGRVASFLDALDNEYGVTGDQLHLLGHSLGAHVVGIAASETKGTVHRVTGLDPARPLFEYPKMFERLDSSDAEIVDVIHTCGGLLGFDEAIGTVDFYPNEGISPQPGCDGLPSITEVTRCSHSMCFHYLSDSIKDPTMYPASECESWEDFKEHRCSNTGYMGEGVTNEMTGTYYLTTKAQTF